MCYPYLSSAGPIQEHVGRLKVAVYGLFAVQEGHARAYVSDDLARLRFGNGVLTVAQERSEVSSRQKLHDEDEAVLLSRDCSVHVDRVGAPEADHRV